MPLLKSPHLSSSYISFILTYLAMYIPRRIHIPSFLLVITKHAEAQSKELVPVPIARLGSSRVHRHTNSQDTSHVSSTSCSNNINELVTNSRNLDD